ncbi:MAG TPA: peptidyl-prolyl cis-trans isomerase [Opitutaceae bacterium]|nr:peptidyl-prolyl cis-trans isomerase [Opitutaceae bacterium]
MISWIQLTFQKHFRLVFAVLLGITIISFIFTIGAAPGIGHGERKVLTRPFFGYNLGSPEDANRISQDASLSVLLRAGYMALDGQQFQQYVEQRVAALDVAKQLNLPAPNPEQLTNFIKTLRIFADEKGEFDAKKYAQFLDQTKTNPQMSQAAVSRVISDDYRSDQVQKKLGGPGYVLPTDIKNQLARADSTWTIGVASVDYASFSPAITPTDVELTKYFEDNSFRYEVQPRVVASYVEFSPASYASGVVLKDDEVKAYYEANLSRFPKPAAKSDDKTAPAVKIDTAKPTDPIADLAAVRPQVEAALKQELASKQAAKAAADFTVALYNQKLTAGAPALATFVASRKLELKSLPPLQRDTPPTGLPIPAEAVDEAFKLSDQRFFSDPVTSPAGSTFVLFWKETQPSYKPLFTEVKAKVLADYQDNEKRKKFVELGKTLRASLEAGIKAPGAAFDKAVAALADGNKGLKIEGKTYPAFTLRQPPQDVAYPALGTLERLAPGQVSDLVIAQDKGYLVYVQDKKLPAFTPDNPQYAATQAQLAQTSANVTRSLVLSEIVANELTKTEPTAARQ